MADRSVTLLPLFPLTINCKNGYQVPRIAQMPPHSQLSRCVLPVQITQGPTSKTTGSAETLTTDECTQTANENCMCWPMQCNSRRWYAGVAGGDGKGCCARGVTRAPAHA